MTDCEFCGKSLGLFNIKYHCASCGKVFCGSCIKTLQEDNRKYDIIGCIHGYNFNYRSKWSGAFRLCPSCFSTFKKYDSKFKSCTGSGIRTYTRNYQGKIPTSEVIINYRSDYYRDKNAAVDEIKRVAEYYGARYVVRMDFIRDTDNDGNYKFSVWAVSGEIVK